ncbi:MAG: DUF6265 family protein [Pseudomonadota bacterium]
MSITKYAAVASLVVCGCTPMQAQDVSLNAHMPERIAGCWVHNDASSHEHWSDTGLGLLFGYSVTNRGGELRAFEDMRIEPSGEGYAFFASPNGKDPVRFESVAVTEDAITFVNLDHDFPQVIEYTQIDNKLVATISLLDGDNEIEFTMLRCRN